MGISVYFGGFGWRKTKPILSFSVLRSEFSVKIKKCYLKKQTQFSNGRMDLSVYMKGDYEEFHASRR